MSWIDVVVIDNNGTVVNLIDINSNIDNDEKNETEWSNIYVERRGRKWGICIGVALLYLLFLLQYYFVFMLVLKEDMETVKAGKYDWLISKP